jgi:hypothetical protein
MPFIFAKFLHVGKIMKRTHVPQCLVFRELLMVEIFIYRGILFYVIQENKNFTALWKNVCAILEWST